MQTSVFRHPWGWTSLAPILCAIHCAAAPLLVLVLPAFAFGTAAEWGLYGVTLGLALLALGSGLRSHRERRVLLPVLGGLGAWGASLGGVFLPVPEAITTAAASLLVAGGLIWSSRLHCDAHPAPCAGCALEAAEPEVTLGDPVADPVPGVGALR